MELFCREFTEKGCKKDTGSQTASQQKRGRSIKAKENSDALNIPTPVEGETKPHNSLTKETTTSHTAKQKVDYQQKNWELQDIRPHRMTKKCKVIWRATEVTWLTYVSM